jgi:hypothetical protein
MGMRNAHRSTKYLNEQFLGTPGCRKNKISTVLEGVEYRLDSNVSGYGYMVRICEHGH